tara:strand:+ start:854 stop:1060 length:207 start_codon:yes stop_codon:yes gene_type:complete
MVNAILLITVIVFWLGAVYLYFLFDRLLDDVRTINEDVQELKALCKLKLEQPNQGSPVEVPDDEFLGI